jgi:TRAP-type C4-dicarboxylate transport system permease small subunit
MNRYLEVVYSVARGMTWVGAVVMVAMTILTCADVILRYFGYPITGAYDITCVLGSVIFSLPIAYSCFKGFQVAVDSVFRRGPRIVRIIVDGIVCLFSMIITGMIAWRAMNLGYELYIKGRVTDTIPIPLWPFIYIMTLGFFVYCLVLLAEYLRTLKKIDAQLQVSEGQDPCHEEVETCQ